VAKIQRAISFLASTSLALAAPAMGQTASTADTTPAAQPPIPVAPTTPPKLLVVISMDQFSGDLFDEYRAYFTGGLKRMSQGVVFPKGYQAHSMTETCPGHSTILTGNRPGHTGIIGNNWIDQSVKRAEKTVYCSEDADAPGATPRNPIASPIRLRVPTLGGRMKDANPASKIVSVAGKDRAAIMMGGNKLDHIWWWGGKSFVSYAGTEPTPLVAGVNARVTQLLAETRPEMDLPDVCKARYYPVAIGPDAALGTGRFARKAGDANAFRASPEFDAAILTLAQKFIEEEKLGQGAQTDLISIGMSATDYVGHSFGTQGAEMCLQIMSADRALAAFFDRLDQLGLDYMVTLTSDHGGQDASERLRGNAMPGAQRVDPGLAPKGINEQLNARLKLKGELVLGDGTFGDVYANLALPARTRALVLKEAEAIYKAHPQVAAVFTRAEILAAPEPSGPPENWSLLTMTKAGYDPERSGDLVVMLKPLVNPVVRASRAYSSHHGSPWDYDRRVPMLFWRKGLPSFEQPRGVETVDIMPTLAAQIGLPLPPKGPNAGYDGRCLDLAVGAPTSCPGE
jgi:predicted AlkP superfamily pyrophosphatase or phosphodiesterase